MVNADKIDFADGAFFLELGSRPQASLEGTSTREIQSEKHLPVSFPDFHVSLSYPSQKAVRTDSSNQVTVVLYGDIYFDKDTATHEILDILLSRYAAQDVIAMAQSLNGSFLLCILDRNKNNVFVITDRLNSKTAFLYRSRNKTYVSTSLRLLPTRKVDPAGCALYLSNTFIFGNRTVLRDVSTLQRASVYCLSSRDLASCELPLADGCRAKVTYSCP